MKNLELTPFCLIETVDKLPGYVVKHFLTKFLAMAVRGGGDLGDGLVVLEEELAGVVGHGQRLAAGDGFEGVAATALALRQHAGPKGDRGRVPKDVRIGLCPKTGQTLLQFGLQSEEVDGGLRQQGGPGCQPL